MGSAERSETRGELTTPHQQPPPRNDNDKPQTTQTHENQVARLGFDREELIDALRSRRQNKATVTYYLVVDNRRPAPAGGWLRGRPMDPGPPSGAFPRT